MTRALFRARCTSATVSALLLLAGVTTPTVVRAAACGGLTVAVDTGHSPSAPGALSARGKHEYAFNKRFTRELVRMARNRPGLHLRLIKQPKDGQELTLPDRSAAALAMKADVFVSIHHDSVNDKYLKTWTFRGDELEYYDGFSGHSIFVSRQGEAFQDSLRLATLLGQHLQAAGRKPTLHHAEDLPNERREILDRTLAIHEAPFQVLTHNKLPAVLFEVGVIVNRKEERRLERRSYRAVSQSALLDALDDFCATRTAEPAAAVAK